MGFNFDYLTSSAGDWIFSKMTVEQIREKYFPDLSAEDFGHLMGIDPTYKPETGYMGQLGRFIMDRYKSGAIVFESDVLKAWAELLDEYWTAKQTKAAKFDVLTMKTMNQLRDALTLSRANEYAVVFDGSSGGKSVLAVHTKTHRANMFFACGVEWCTTNTSGTYWNSYSDAGELLQVIVGATLSNMDSIKASKKRYQAYSRTNQTGLEVEDQHRESTSIEDFLTDIGPQAAAAVQAFMFDFTGADAWNDFTYNERSKYVMTEDGSELRGDSGYDDDDEEGGITTFFRLEVADREIELSYREDDNHGDYVDGADSALRYTTLGSYFMDEMILKDYKLFHALGIYPGDVEAIIDGSIDRMVIDGFDTADDHETDSLSDITPFVWLFSDGNYPGHYHRFSESRLYQRVFDAPTPFSTEDLPDLGDAEARLGFYTSSLRSTGRSSSQGDRFTEGMMSMLYNDLYGSLSNELLDFLDGIWDLGIEAHDYKLGCAELWEKYLVPRVNPTVSLHIPGNSDEYRRDTNRYPYTQRTFFVREDVSYSDPVTKEDRTLWANGLMCRFVVSDTTPPYLRVVIEKQAAQEELDVSAAVYDEAIRQLLGAAKDFGTQVYVIYSGAFSVSTQLVSRLRSMGAVTMDPNPDRERPDTVRENWLDISGVSFKPKPKQTELFVAEAEQLENQAIRMTRYLGQPYSEWAESGMSNKDGLFDSLASFVNLLKLALRAAAQSGSIPEYGTIADALAQLGTKAALAVYSWVREYPAFLHGYTGYQLSAYSDGTPYLDLNMLGTHEA